MIQTNPNPHQLKYTKIELGQSFVCTLLHDRFGNYADYEEKTRNMWYFF